MRSRPARYAFLLLVLRLTTAHSAWAEDKPESGIQRDGNLEIAVIGGATFISPIRGENLTVWGFPTGSSVYPGTPFVRLTNWSHKELLLDFALSFTRLSSDFSVVNLEAGVGRAFTIPDSKVVPFIMGLGGFLTISGTGTDPATYVGGMAGLRVFTSRRVATRFQAGYRHFLGDSLNIDHSIELSVGIGVFI